MFLDQTEGRGLGLLGECPQAFGAVLSEMLLQPVLVAPLAGMKLAAVPSRCAPADPLGLDQHHVDTRLGEVQRRRQTGVAAANDGDMRLHGFGQWWKGERRVGRRSIEGRGVGGRQLLRSCFG